MPKRAVSKAAPAAKPLSWQAPGLFAAAMIGAGVLGFGARPANPGPDYAAMRAPTVELWVGKTHDDQDGHGSGVIVSPTFILTVAHVTAMAEDGRMHVRFADGSDGEAVVVWEDAKRDTAMVALTKATHIRPARLATAVPSVGDSVWAVGYPLFLPQSVQEGKVASDQVPAHMGPKVPQASSSMIINCTVLRGDSGGPIYNVRGEVVGLSDFDFIDVLGGMFPVWTDLTGIVGVQYIRDDVREVAGI